MEVYLPYLISVIGGAVIPAILARFGIKVPVITPTVPTPAPVVPSPWSPSPQPVPVPVVQPHASLLACMEWSAKVRAGLMLATDADKKAISSLCPMLHEIEKPTPPEPAKPVG